MKEKALRRNKSLWLLLCLYAGTVLIRYALALLTTSYPTIKIDEFLYSSLGRSIATKGELLYRGQAADYAFILYPLILSPVYLFFGEGAHFYRLIQLWNILLMSTSVFPLFFLGKKMGLEKRTLIAAALSMMIPDFILGEFIFSEAILFPLFFTLMYCVYSYMDDGRPRWILWAGLIGGLLYSTKPGTVVPAGVFILFATVRAMIRKDGKNAAWPAGGIAVFLATAAAFWALAKFAFGYQGSFLSIYNAQFNGVQEWHFGVFLKNLAIYPFYFILSCGITGVLCPVISHRTWKAEDKAFWLFAIISLAAMIIGSAWMLEQAEDVNNIQTRYVTMYMPLMLLFCFIQGQKAENKKGQKQKLPGIISAAVLTGYIAVCALIIGCKANAHSTDTHSQIAVSLLNDRILPLSSEIWGNLIILLLCTAAFLLFLKCSGKKGFNTICVSVMAGTMLINGICGYSFIFRYHSSEREKDGLAVHQLTEGKPYIYILSGESVGDYGTDVNAKQNNCTVYLNDFINCLQNNNGCYVPYVPGKMRGMLSANKLPDVDTLVVDKDSYPFLQWSRSVTVQSPYDRGTIYVVKFISGERIADSTIGNMRNKVLTPELPGVLVLYDEDYYQKPLTVRMEIGSDTTQEITINSTHEIYSIHLTPGMAWYEVTFDHAEEAFNIKVRDASITINAYELISGGS